MAAEDHMVTSGHIGQEAGERRMQEETWEGFA
jgi:hypothetical protein